VSCSRAVTVGKTLRHVLPMPGARIDVRRGDTLDSRATVEQCQQALDALG
jgi:hypothetical protein